LIKSKRFLALLFINTLAAWIDFFLTAETHNLHQNLTSYGELNSIFAAKALKFEIEALEK
jgi:hypothetical protein